MSIKQHLDILNDKKKSKLHLKSIYKLGQWANSNTETRKKIIEERGLEALIRNIGENLSSQAAIKFCVRTIAGLLEGINDEMIAIMTSQDASLGNEVILLMEKTMEERILVVCGAVLDFLVVNDKLPYQLTEKALNNLTTSLYYSTEQTVIKQGTKILSLFSSYNMNKKLIAENKKTMEYLMSMVDVGPSDFQQIQTSHCARTIYKIAMVESNKLLILHQTNFMDILIHHMGESDSYFPLSNVETHIFLLKALILIVDRKGKYSICKLFPQLVPVMLLRLDEDYSNPFLPSPHTEKKNKILTTTLIVLKTLCLEDEQVQQYLLDETDIVSVLCRIILREFDTIATFLKNFWAMEKENSTSRVYGAISERENEVVPHLSLRRLALYTLIALGNTADKAEKNS